ncbi:hypothetical protein S83_035262 [Arachis hypogaea]
MVELQGLKSVEGKDSPKILHLNPRLRGDWSKRPVIEHNTCYRMHWEQLKNVMACQLRMMKECLKNHHCGGCVVAGREWRFEGTQTG